MSEIQNCKNVTAAGPDYMRKFTVWSVMSVVARFGIVAILAFFYLSQCFNCVEPVKYKRYRNLTIFCYGKFTRYSPASANNYAGPTCPVFLRTR